MTNSYFTDRSDSDSPFIAAWAQSQAEDGLAVYSVDELDEFASITDYLLSFPANAGDADLMAFGDLLYDVITCRRSLEV